MPDFGRLTPYSCAIYARVLAIYAMISAGSNGTQYNTKSWSPDANAKSQQAAETKTENWNTIAGGSALPMESQLLRIENSIFSIFIFNMEGLKGTDLTPNERQRQTD
jgi:hypothetical protein